MQHRIRVRIVGIDARTAGRLGPGDRARLQRGSDAPAAILAAHARQPGEQHIAGTVGPQAGHPGVGSVRIHRHQINALLHHRRIDHLLLIGFQPWRSEVVVAGNVRQHGGFQLVGVAVALRIVSQLVQRLDRDALGGELLLQRRKPGWIELGWNQG